MPAPHAGRVRVPRRRKHIRKKRIKRKRKKEKMGYPPYPIFSRGGEKLFPPLEKERYGGTLWRSWFFLCHRDIFEIPPNTHFEFRREPAGGGVEHVAADVVR